VKIDTGMHRLGFKPEALKIVLNGLNDFSWINGAPNLMTHFSDADDIGNAKTKKQATEFFNLTKEFSGVKSLANSAGIIGWPDSHADWVRPGIMLYGVSPMTGATGLEHDLKPVMTLQSELIVIHDLKKGDCVGYGSTWQCPEDMRVGVVSIGYGDGYPFAAKQGTPVLVGDQKVPLVGRVSMDMITVDLRTCLQAKIHDKVTLWGDGLPVEIIAKQAGTISYELLCGIAQRVRSICRFDL